MNLENLIRLKTTIKIIRNTKKITLMRFLVLSLRKSPTIKIIDGINIEIKEAPRIKITIAATKLGELRAYSKNTATNSKKIVKVIEIATILYLRSFGKIYSKARITPGIRKK
mgnify:CR=1 FL=1